MVKHPVDVHVGQKMRHRRWLVGMTQQQLAEAVGIKFQQIQKYESGANRTSASRLWDISRVMNVQVSYFFEGLEEGAPQPALLERLATEGDGRVAYDLIRSFHRLPADLQRSIRALTHSLAESYGTPLENDKAA